MILKSVRVQNFKCVEDSEEFSIAPVTCLVGKNESGKSTLLQALYKLKPDIEARGKFNLVEEYPRRHLAQYEKKRERDPQKEEATVVTTTWELDKEDQKLITDKFGSGALKSNTVTISKGYGNIQYWTIPTDEKEVVAHFLKSAGLSKDEATELEKLGTIQEVKTKLEALKTPTLSTSQSALLQNLKETFKDGTAAKAAIAVLDDQLPTFLYFSEYLKMPGKVSIDQLMNKKANGKLDDEDRVFLALLSLVGTTPEEIQKIGKFEELIAKLEAVSNNFSEEIFTYWTQNKHLEVQFHFDSARSGDPYPYNSGWIFRTRIKNNRHKVTVGFDERSSGFTWFFSFLVWFSQVQKNYGENLIILLDEPGLNLHARAQADWLRYINEKLKPHYQVIYTTHSPFMVDPDNLLSARTVEDVTVDETILGTRVGDKIFSTDADTIFPLQAALGYDLAQTLFVGKNILLVEGPSDLLYLKWFSQELKNKGRESLDQRWVITPSGGVDKIGSFLTLFRGNKLNVAILTDIQDGQKKKIRDLKESNLLKKGQVFSAEMYAGQAEADIEDILGRPLYAALVNKCYTLDDSKKIPENKPKGVSIRIIEEVESHFRTLSADDPEFDHYSPASFLLENTADLRASLPGIDDALDKFEKLFKDLNALLGDHSNNNRSAKKTTSPSKNS